MLQKHPEKARRVHHPGEAAVGLAGGAPRLAVGADGEADRLPLDQRRIEGDADRERVVQVHTALAVREIDPQRVFDDAAHAIGERPRRAREHAAGAADRRRVRLDREGQVGQRAERDDREAALVAARRVHDHPRRVDRGGARLDGGPVWQVAEPIDTVVRRDLERPRQRTRRPGGDERRGQRPAQVDQPENVAGARLQRDVAGDDRDHVHRPLR